MTVKSEQIRTEDEYEQLSKDNIIKNDTVTTEKIRILQMLEDVKLERYDRYSLNNNIKGRNFERKINYIVTRIMKTIGVPPNVAGYKFLKKAIVISVKDEEKDQQITKTIYPEIARYYKTTIPKVERGIRNAITLTWQKGNKLMLAEYFKNKILNKEGRPTNSFFITTIANQIIMDNYEMLEEGRCLEGATKTRC